MLGNLSQVSSLFGTVGMYDETDFYEYRSPDFTLSKASLAIELVPAECTVKVQQTPRSKLPIHTKTSSTSLKAWRECENTHFTQVYPDSG